MKKNNNPQNHTNRKSKYRGLNLNKFKKLIKKKKIMYYKYNNTPLFKNIEIKQHTLLLPFFCPK